MERHGNNAEPTMPMPVFSLLVSRHVQHLRVEHGREVTREAALGDLVAHYLGLEHTRIAATFSAALAAAGQQEVPGNRAFNLPPTPRRAV
jgi:hypothetical protein